MLDFSGIKCFELVKRVLDEQYQAITDPAKDDAIRKRLDELHDVYKDLTRPHSIDYADPITWFAYVSCYVAAHAVSVYNIVGQCRELQDVLAEDTITISCVGGGPGSDLLGILKHLAEKQLSPRLTCWILDSEQLWQECWCDIFDDLGQAYQGCSFTFASMDVCDSASWGPQRKHLSADLFTLVFFLSEVYQHKQQAEPYLHHLLDSMSDGAILLYVDNNHSAFYGWLDGLLAAHGLRVLLSETEDMRLPWEEEKTDLGEYYDKFGSPRLTLDIAYRVASKV